MTQHYNKCISSQCWPCIFCSFFQNKNIVWVLPVLFLAKPCYFLVLLELLCKCSYIVGKFLKDFSTLILWNTSNQWNYSGRGDWTCLVCQGICGMKSGIGVFCWVSNNTEDDVKKSDLSANFYLLKVCCIIGTTTLNLFGQELLKIRMPFKLNACTCRWNDSLCFMEFQSNIHDIILPLHGLLCAVYMFVIKYLDNNLMWKYMLIYEEMLRGKKNTSVVLQKHEKSMPRAIFSISDVSDIYICGIDSWNLIQMIK